MSKSKKHNSLRDIEFVEWWPNLEGTVSEKTARKMDKMSRFMTPDLDIRAGFDEAKMQGSTKRGKPL